MTTPVTPAPPSGGSLLRATLIALAVAGVLLVTCVLPAEYGKDPTGIGRLLGLTQMGEVKMAIAEEAAANAAAQAAADSIAAAAEGRPTGDAAASGADSTAARSDH
ncbi:MAG: hypothetical protein IT355_20915 [Gemmatimonadaceae bacterium]|nr:hypothetical protein [Gemmatimonadaceae bacterium]